MDKNKAVQMIRDLQFDEQKENELISLINNSVDLTPEVLNQIADLIEVEAKKDNEEADQLIAVASIYSDTANEIQQIEDEAVEEKEKIVDDTLKDLKVIKEEVIKGKEQQNITNPQDQKLEDIRNNLVQAAGAAPTNSTQ